MQTVTIDILDNKAVRILQDLEQLQLIRIRKEKALPETQSNLIAKYKGAMTKKTLADIENQLTELRNKWK